MRIELKQMLEIYHKVESKQSFKSLSLTERIALKSILKALREGQNSVKVNIDNKGIEHIKEAGLVASNELGKNFLGTIKKIFTGILGFSSSDLKKEVEKTETFMGLHDFPQNYEEFCKKEFQDVEALVEQQKNQTDIYWQRNAIEGYVKALGIKILSLERSFPSSEDKKDPYRQNKIELLNFLKSQFSDILSRNKSPDQKIIFDEISSKIKEKRQGYEN